MVYQQQHAWWTQSTLDATKCAVKIIDVNYERADLQSVVQDNCSNLSNPEQNRLLEVLQDYEDFFDGTLGDWKAKLVSFELKVQNHMMAELFQF